MYENISIAILQLLSTSGIGISKVNSIVELSRLNNIPFCNFLTDSNLLTSVLSEKQIHSFSETYSLAQKTFYDLQAENVNLVTIIDNDYPKSLIGRLKKLAPPLIMYKGNSSLFNTKGAGFCGSRSVSPRGLRIASSAAEQLSHETINVVSGYAAGVDMAVHQSALENGGTTTIVLAEGIKHFRIKTDLRPHWNWDKILVVSEFLPGLTWSVRNAMQRNNTICALSEAMLVIEAGTTGGSIAAGRASIRMGVPLFAPLYEGMPDNARGNYELVQEGGYPINVSSDVLSTYEMKPIFSISSNGRVAPSTQMKMFD